jgi:hypothetical protein
MFKLLVCASLVALSASVVGAAPDRSECAPEVQLLEGANTPCEREYSNLSYSGYASVASGVGEGITPVRGGQSEASLGGVFSYVWNYASFHGLGEYTGERKGTVRFLFADMGDGDYGVRVGRVQQLFGFYNQKRNLPKVAEYIAHPPAIYREQFRDLASSGDGYQVYGTVPIFGWELRAQWSEARPVLYPMGDFSRVFVGERDAAVFTDESRVHAGGVTLSSPTRTLQFKVDRIYLDFQAESRTPFLPSGGLGNVVDIVGARWFVTDTFDVTLEHAWITPVGPVNDVIFSQLYHPGQNRGSVFSIRYRPDADWEINAYMDRYCVDHTDCGGDLQSDFVGGYYPPSWFYTNSHGVFARRKLPDNWSIGAQYTEGKGTDATFGGDRNSKPEWKTLVFTLTKTW